MKLVKFQGARDRPVWVNPECVLLLRSSDAGGTVIFFHDDSSAEAHVVENPEKVAMRLQR